MRIALVLGVVIALGAAPVHAAPITVSHDAATHSTTIQITAKKGNIQWSHVVRAIARAKGFDDKALDGLLPGGGFALDSAITAVTLAGMNAALSPTLTVTVGSNGSNRTLIVTLDKRALLASARRLRKVIREALMNRLSGDEQSFGLELDSDWNRRKKRLVLFVHGFHASPETSTFHTLRAEVKQRGHGTGVARYPNDQSIRDSGTALATELKKLAKNHPKRKIILIAKSMGGLVSRYVLETPGLDPGNVDQLIMIGTPNQGSLLAHFGFALELWEHVVEKDQSTTQAFYSSIEDGLGDAAEDLVPDSVFLAELNARKRNPKVKYSILLGNKGYLTVPQLAALRVVLAQKKNSNRFLQLLGPKLDTYLAELDEVVRGLGDGAVSIKRGRLTGVRDTQVLPFEHLGASEACRPLRDAVLARLL